MAINRANPGPSPGKKPDSATQRRVDPAAETDDPTKTPGDNSQLTPDHALVDQEQPIESALEQSFPPTPPPPRPPR
ncbi:MAG: hypothetical protein M3N23_12960 [Pseudomonadota bacterium]|nr:hypothetical protein [Pseudomonadota bacterium]